MKNFYALVSFLFCIGLTLNATTTIITVDGCSFNPSVHNANVGDTIIWTLTVPQNRMTSSTVIPAGAQPWDALLTTATPEFKYVPTVVGDYYYKSNILPTCIAVLHVTDATGISTYQIQEASKAYPNPVKDNLTLIHPQGATKVVFYNETGKKVKEALLDTNPGMSNTVINVSDLAFGLYIYTLFDKKGPIESKRIIRIE